MKRLEVAEKKLGSTVQTKYVVLDFDGRFFGECGFDLSQEQFDAWVKQKGMDVEVTIIKYAIDGEGNPLSKSVSNPIEAKKEPAQELEDKR
jgi:hypothetical protein